MTSAIPDIICEGVSHLFETDGGHVSALEGVNLKIERESLFVIVGPSGCGKSTLLRLMLGLETASEGRVWINPDRMSRISYVPQAAQLLPWRTAMQNACLALEVRNGQLDKADIFHIKGEFLRYDLGGFEHARWDSLSGGMRQKVTLICALSGQPKILLCDEPFSAIDFVTRLDMLTKFKKQCLQGVTTVFVTHNIEEAIFLGERIGVMSSRPGRIKAIHANPLGQDATDAVECRRDPRFQPLFEKIWRELREDDY